MGLGNDVTNYVWNWMIFLKQQAGIVGCFTVGGFLGLTFDDDDGAMIYNCMDIWGGFAVTYPAYFISEYSVEPEAWSWCYSNKETSKCSKLRNPLLDTAYKSSSIIADVVTLLRMINLIPTN